MMKAVVIDAFSKANVTQCYNKKAHERDLELVDRVYNVVQ